MKNISLAANAVLFVLIIVLFFMYASLKKKISPQMQPTSQSTGSSGTLRIAYINADSINANYKLMEAFQAEIQQRQNALQNSYNAKEQNLEQEYAGYQQKMQAGNISQVDAEKAQKDMEQKKSQLDAIQAKQSDLVKEVQARNLEIQQKVQNYVAQYNKTAHYDYIMTYLSVGGTVLYANRAYDITNAIISGLNKQYADSTSSAPPSSNSK